ncbi:MAG: UDP-N-acetylglucosamine diphosphorylase [Verrucomicrobia bacterium]|nr:UDP-N-acetylglucosamine diphosphorylase [Verrucomicrobiota bacterium]
MIRTADLLDLAQLEHAALFDGCEFPWQALARIKDYLRKNLKSGNHGTVVGSPFIGRDVFVGEGTVIEQGAFVKGPALIGRNCQIRAGAYVRENVIAGDDCVLGNSCEFKNAVLLNGAQAPHFNYVGDSILGCEAHLGAGVICSNLKSLAGNVTVAWEGKTLDTGLRKFGAVVGDRADIGCNCVLNPGSIIGRGSVLYPTINWRGVCPPESVVKLRQQHQVITRRK